MFIYSPTQLSFKRPDTHTFTYATPTLITEALQLVTRVQLFLQLLQ